MSEIENKIQEANNKLALIKDDDLRQAFTIFNDLFHYKNQLLKDEIMEKVDQVYEKLDDRTDKQDKKISGAKKFITIGFSVLFSTAVTYMIRTEITKYMLEEHLKQHEIKGEHKNKTKDVTMLRTYKY